MPPDTPLEDTQPIAASPPTHDQNTLAMPNSSPNTVSSATSLGSTDSASRPSSHSSVSPPSPFIQHSKSTANHAPSIELSDLSSSEPPPIDPLPSPTCTTLTQSNDPPRSTPVNQPISSAAVKADSWLSRFRKWAGKNAIGLTTLGTTIVFGTVFTRPILRWTHLQVCQGQVQVNASLNPALDDACREAIAKGPDPSPIRLARRAYAASSNAALTMAKRFGSTFKDESSHVHYERDHSPAFTRYNQTFNNNKNIMNDWRVVGTITLLISLLGVFITIKTIRRPKVKTPESQSLARSELRNVQVTRHYNDGPQQVSTGQGIRVIKHKPDEQHYLGHLSRRIRKSQVGIENEVTDEDQSWSSHNSSSSTLVPWTPPLNAPSKVSLLTTTKDSEEHSHEGLIELESRGPNKNFFDPETGEFIHLSPWVSTHEDSGNDDDSKDTRHAIAQMATGAGAFAGGKPIEDFIWGELNPEEEDNDGDGQEEEEEGMKLRMTPTAGDAMSGLTTNEGSARPQIH